MNNQESKPNLVIEYCPKCRWLARATWMAQEFLTTFDDDLASLILVPSDSGVFKVKSTEKEIFCRKRDGGFIEIKIIKQRIRDTLFPEKKLGHSDKKE